MYITFGMQFWCRYFFFLTMYLSSDFIYTVEILGFLLIQQILVNLLGSGAKPHAGMTERKMHYISKPLEQSYICDGIKQCYSKQSVGKLYVLGLMRWTGTRMHCTVCFFVKNLLWGKKKLIAELKWCIQWCLIFLPHRLLTHL